MTTINTWCPRCGTENSVPAGAVLAMVTAEALDTDDAVSVAWICDGCGHLVSVPVPWHTVTVLLTAGVDMLELDADLERVTSLPPHPEQPPAGRAFTPDDLLELHQLLAADTWFSALTRE